MQKRFQTCPIVNYKCDVEDTLRSLFFKTRSNISICHSTGAVTVLHGAPNRRVIHDHLKVFKSFCILWWILSFLCSLPTGSILTPQWSEPWEWAGCHPLPLTLPPPWGIWWLNWDPQSVTCNSRVSSPPLNCIEPVVVPCCYFLRCLMIVLDLTWVKPLQRSNFYVL